MSSYYRLLGVSRFASVDEIRHAYWALTHRLRRQPRRDEGRLAEIRQAYEVLSDAQSRRGYDRARRVDTCDAGVEARVPRAGGAAATVGSGIERRLSAGEVRLGFPSMARLVPRMLAQFAGPAGPPGGATHQTQVRLTVREAHEGARIPLAIRVRPDCPVCGGRGESWAAPCGACDGTGVGSLSHQVTFPIPPGVRDGMRLTFSVAPPFAAEARVELRIAVQ